MNSQLQTKKLLEPFDLHGLTLANRVSMAPLTRARSGVDRIPNALMGEYYAQRASAGLIIRKRLPSPLKLMGGTNPLVFTPMR